MFHDAAKACKRLHIRACSWKFLHIYNQNCRDKKRLCSIPVSRSHAGDETVTRLVFIVTFRLNKVYSLSPPNPIRLKSFNCPPWTSGGSVAVGSLNQVVTVCKQPAKYGKLQLGHKHFWVLMKHALCFCIHNTFYSAVASSFILFLHYLQSCHSSSHTPFDSSLHTAVDTSHLTVCSHFPFIQSK